MIIHSDTLTSADLHGALQSIGQGGVCVEFTTHGSRKRARSFRVTLTAVQHVPGRRRRNGGNYGAVHAYAATYAEWGQWINALLEIDPHAIVGPYDGRKDFHAQTFGAYRTGRIFFRREIIDAPYRMFGGDRSGVRFRHLVNGPNAPAAPGLMSLADIRKLPDEPPLLFKLA